MNYSFFSQLNAYINSIKVNKTSQDKLMMFKAIKSFYSVLRKKNLQSFLCPSSTLIKIYFYKINNKTILTDLLKNKWFFFKVN